jgi:hypothetical protein
MVTKAKRIRTQRTDRVVAPATQDAGHLAVASSAEGDKVAIALIAKVDVVAVVDLKRSRAAAQAALAVRYCQLAQTRSVVAPATARYVGGVVHIVLQVFAGIAKSDSHNM